MLKSISWPNLVTLSKTPAIRHTFGYYLLFIAIGLDVGLTGPTLPALAAQTQTRLGDMGTLFVVGAIGYTIGTALGGRIFDRARGHPVLGIAELVVAGFLALVPVVPWFWLLLAVVFGKGIAGGLINTGANTLLTWTHGEKVSPFMNALHFFFGLGAFLSPLLVAQVITIEGGYRWAYWTMAVFAALVGLRVLTMSGSPKPHQHEAQTENTPQTAAIPYAIVLTAALFLFFYVGAEITFGGWVYTYAVTLGLATAAGAAYLTSGFWLSFTIGRLISIPMATRFKPEQIILAALVGCLTILVVAMFVSGSSLVVWLLALGLGFCMAPIWPTGFTLAGQSFKLTAKASSIILLGDSFGGMVLPWLVGQVIELTGPQAMVIMVFGSLVLNLLAFAGMLRLRRPKVQA